MKITTVIMADLERAPLGQPSRLATDLCGQPVLRRTVERVLRSKRVGRVHVAFPAGQRDAAPGLLAGMEAVVETFDAPPAPYAALVQAGRQWGLDGWRGGIGGLSWFDEDIHVPVAAALALREKADALVCVPAHAALIAPDLMDAMIEHYAKHAPRERLTLAVAPPGLAPAIFAVDLLAQLSPSAQPPGSLLAYGPDNPLPDITGKDACYRPAAIIGELRGRLTADTTRSFERVRGLIEAGAGGWTAEQIAQHVHGRLASDVQALPEEIEIELTTRDPLAQTTVLRPRGADVGRRGPLSLEHVRCIADSIRGADDIRIVLGGFGDPMEHPDLPDIVRILRDAGAMSIAVRTTGLAGDEGLDDALFKIPVDVLSVTLDAASPGGFRSVHGVDEYERVTARIERWMRWRTDRRQVRPLIVPEMIKSTHTVAEMEAFVDGWTRRLGWATVSGYSHCAGQRPDHSVMPMAPPRRIPCRRLWTRMMVLADGNIVACDQDFAARRPLGNLGQSSLAQIWSGPALQELRDHHRRASYAIHPLCPGCAEWHRP